MADVRAVSKPTMAVACVGLLFEFGVGTETCDLPAFWRLGFESDAILMQGFPKFADAMQERHKLRSIFREMLEVLFQIRRKECTDSREIRRG